MVVIYASYFLLLPDRSLSTGFATLPSLVKAYLCDVIKSLTIMPAKITNLLGDKAEYFLNHTCKTIDKSTLHLPSPTHVEDNWINSNRSNQVLRSLQSLLDHG